ncbi:MAG: CHAT domain-containing protein [Bacteroidia bacterium]|nr:CHAT domain-containing protein [Bacteroidia bacterium]MCX7651852.1 CHAT domain-containing protein [Bacteroidia bacterium]MDW8415998.1 CHAT domain-containing tetratricopeptide repeat protein [Bacteroidia bacterium]
MRTSIFLISILIAQTKIDYADSLRENGDYEAAFAIYDSLRRQTNIPDTTLLYLYLTGAECLANLENHQEGEKWIDAGIKVAQRLRDTLGWSTLLYYLAWIRDSQGRFIEAESLYTLIKEWQENLEGVRKNALYTQTLNNLGLIKSTLGDYRAAENLYQQAISIQKDIAGPADSEYLTMLANLAVLYSQQGRYGTAEAIYKEIIQSIETHFHAKGRKHPDYPKFLSSLGEVYTNQGRYAEAESLLNQSARIKAQLFGTANLSYLITLNNLASLYSLQNRYQEALTLFKEIAQIMSQMVGESAPSYLVTLNNLTIVYQKLKQYEEAEKLYKITLRKLEERFGKNHSTYAINLGGLGSLYEEQGRYDEAEQILTESARLISATLGEKNQYYAFTLHRLASVWGKMKKYEQADSLWKAALRIFFQYLRQELSTLPAAYQERFLETNLTGRFRDFQQYVALRSKPPSSLILLGYRVGRSTKGLILTASEGLRHLAESSPDSSIRRLFLRWRELMAQYAALAMQERHSEADSIQRLTTEVEQSLLYRLPEIKAYFPDPFSEPEPELRKDEALIEVIQTKGQNSVLYNFYLFLPEKRRHRLHLYVLRVDSAWEKRAQNVYEILRSPEAQLTALAYRLLWNFIDSLLPKSVKRVYFSPDGIYYRINVGTLYDGKTFVADRYDVRHVASSRRLVLKQRQFPSQPPVVIGNPAFGIAPSVGAGTGMRVYRLFQSAIPPLPEAEAEAAVVARLLGVEPLIGEAATEERVKLLRSPKVLHIATHGYFQEGRGSPLLRAGLLLAGAAVWDSLYPPLGIEDGLLTAREVSSMNLLGTELVTLSACETGLGDITGEGLYGLQRAFLEAGAKRVIATLWPIDDAATREIMTSFYQKWTTALKSNSSPTKYSDKGEEIIDQAFADALRDFRRRYKSPYYWGAFILMR